jgi:hypothetical protein
MPRCIKPGVTCIEGRPVVVILVIGALVIGAAILTLTVWYPEWWSVPTAASKPPVRRVRRDFPGGECRFRQAQHPLVASRAWDYGERYQGRG